MMPQSTTVQQPPAPPAREEWGFVEELARREPRASHWTRAARDGELDLSGGVAVVDRYGAGDGLATATEDLASAIQRLICAWRGRASVADSPAGTTAGTTTAGESPRVRGQC